MQVWSRERHASGPQHEVDRRRTLVGERGTAVRDALAAVAVAGRGLKGVKGCTERVLGSGSCSTTDGAATRWPAVVPSERASRAVTAAAVGGSRIPYLMPHTPSPYCNTQIVAKTNNQMMSTRCQNSDTPSAQMPTDSSDRARTDRTYKIARAPSPAVTCAP